MLKIRLIMALCAGISISLSSICAHHIAGHESKRKYPLAVIIVENHKKPENIEQYITQEKNINDGSKTPVHYRGMNSSLGVNRHSNDWKSKVGNFVINTISRSKKLLTLTWGAARNSLKSSSRFIKRNQNVSVAGASIALAATFSICADYFCNSYKELLKLSPPREPAKKIDYYKYQHIDSRVETISMNEIELANLPSPRVLSDRLSNQVPAQTDLISIADSSQLKKKPLTEDEFFNIFEQYYYYPITADGNCGFKAIAKGLNALVKFSGRHFDQYQIRQHLHRSRKNHSITQMYDNPELPEEDIHEVLEDGLYGYWFGNSETDIQRISNEFLVRIEIFDISQHKITAYTPQTEQEEGDLSQNVIRLLYDGSGVSGHYDLLLE